MFWNYLIREDSILPAGHYSEFEPTLVTLRGPDLGRNWERITTVFN